MNIDILKAKMKHLEQNLNICLQETSICSEIIEGQIKETRQINRVNFEYQYAPKVMYTIDQPHVILFDIINQMYANYIYLLEALFQHIQKMHTIQLTTESDTAPYWKNGYFSSMDAVCLYCLLVEKKPSVYLEIGSGNSTKWAKQAILDHKLDTKIVSIDPHPRAEIDRICDEVVRTPLEDADIGIFTSLPHDTIVLIDNSHRSFQNSDVTVVFLNILPVLPSEVIVGFHDIFLPYDYPAEWKARYYNEQYMLACYLCGGSRGFNITLPVNFMIKTPHIVNTKTISNYIDFFKTKQAPFYRSSFYMQKSRIML